MTPHRKKCPHVVHFNVKRDWFETNSRHQKRYSEGGKKIRGCRGLLGRVTVLSTTIRVITVIKMLWTHEAQLSESATNFDHCDDAYRCR